MISLQIVQNPGSGSFWLAKTRISPWGATPPPFDDDFTQELPLRIFGEFARNTLCSPFRLSGMDEDRIL
jgi:hypothetical protein